MCVYCIYVYLSGNTFIKKDIFGSDQGGVTGFYSGLLKIRNRLQQYACMHSAMMIEGDRYCQLSVHQKYSS